MEFSISATNDPFLQPSDLDSFSAALKLDSPVDSDVEEFFLRPGYRARCRKNTIDSELALDGAYPWQCWVCGRIFYSLSGQSSHMRKCVIDRFTGPPIAGCPFCPRDIESSNLDTFPMRHYNRHIMTCHPSVTNFQCTYCLRTLSTATIEELVCHMICYHRIPWRPSPVSMSYLREDDLPHRTITCMGCGWCTVVLRADNAVHPPSSIVAHMKNCSFKGGQIRLQPLSSTALTSSLEQTRLICEAERIGRLFADSYPLVRGYPLVIPDDPFPSEDYTRPKVKLLSSRLDANEDPDLEDLLSNRLLANGWIEFQRPYKKRKPRPEAQIEFDVPLTLPPVPDHNQLGGVHKKSTSSLYVCPLCGDNALSTLRERDEHLQAAHNGELVFPCQICGLAYPLYIALRRHAALKHDSQFDLVRYGPPELIDSDPTECPECELVAFTDKHVLKLHMVKLHSIVMSMTRKPPKPLGKKPNVKRPASNSLGSDPKEPKSKMKRLSAMSSSKSSRSAPQERSKSNRNSADPIFSGISHLERVLSRVSGASAPATCLACHTSVDNEKELRLHLELDHSETEQNCEQLGCQACGRIFFGSGGRIDLIGHLRVIHQESEQVDVLTCPHSTESSPKRCHAQFSSPRLRHLHIAATASRHPTFACPLIFNSQSAASNTEASHTHDQLHRLIMDTEVAADQEGLMILAYCCPNCSRLFAGEQATARFAVHRIRCQPEQQLKIEEPHTLAGIDALPDTERELKLDPPASTASFEIALVDDNADDSNKLF